MMPSMVLADNLVFTKTKIVAPEGEKTKQIKVIVTWKDSSVAIRLKEPKKLQRYGHLETEIAYKTMSNLTYEYSKHWRVVSAILLNPLALFSRRKHHWFSFTYKDADGKSDAMVLRLDKKEELSYRRRVPALTGLELKVHIDK
jgi:hypothetical protein